MREDTIFMSCHSSSIPVINYPSITPHESVSKVGSSSGFSSMAPQDCSCTSERTSSSPLNLTGQSDSFSSTSTSKSDAIPLRIEEHSSIKDHSEFTVSNSSISQDGCSSSLLLNGSTTTLHSFNHSSMNGSPTSEPASSTSLKSPLKFSCQPENSSTSCQDLTSISKITYMLQDSKSISEHGRSERSSTPHMNGASTSRTITYSTSTLGSSSYITVPTEDPTNLSPMSVVSKHEGSTPAFTCQHAKAIIESQSQCLSGDCSSDDFPCVCTCEAPDYFPPQMSSSDLNCSLVKSDNLVSTEVDCNHSGKSSTCRVPQTSQSLNYYDLSRNITPMNSVASQIHPYGEFTSSEWSTQSYQSPKFPEIELVSTNSVDQYSHFSTNFILSCPSPNAIDSSVTNDLLNSPTFPYTPPSQDITCPTSTELILNLQNSPRILPSCPHVFTHKDTLMYDPISEEGKQVRECEVCKASLDNKVRMDQDRQLCEDFLDSLSRFEDWLQTTQITTSLAYPYKTLHREAKLVLRKYEVLLTEMREKLLDLESLNRQYWKLTQTPQQMLLPSVLRSRMQEVNALWDSLQGEAETLHRTFKSRVQQREEFETDQDDMKLCLTEMDLELSNVEYIYGGNSTEKIQQLKAFQEDVWSNMKRVEGLLERGDQLIDDSDPRDAADLEVEMTELGSYCQQIYIRLSRLQKRLVSTKLVFEDDFLDSAIEHLSSGSSDVFLDLDIEGEEDSSPVNVPFPRAALPADLEWDPLGDVGGSSSHDGQESFYTATSAPRKISQRSEGSRSSLSSYSGVSNSNVRRYAVMEPLEDIHTNHSLSQDMCQGEWTQGKSQMKNTMGTNNSILHLKTDLGRDTIPCSDSKSRMDNHFAVPGYSWKITDPESPWTSYTEVIDDQSQSISSGQRRRQRKKKRGVRNQDAKWTLKSTKSDVSILMENGDDLSHLDLHKPSYRPSCSLCFWIKRLTLVSILLLVLFTSLLFPWGSQNCPSKHFSWSLMLTYVNGPPPT